MRGGFCKFVIFPKIYSSFRFFIFQNQFWRIAAKNNSNRDLLCCNRWYAFHWKPLIELSRRINIRIILFKTNVINIDLYLELKVTHDHKTLSRKIIFLEATPHRLHYAQTKPMPFEYCLIPYQFSSRLYIG